MNRREFLKGAVMAPAAVAASPWPVWNETINARPGRVTAVVFDERYADCRIFAEFLARQGAVAFRTGGDAAGVWYGPMRAHLERYGGSVAGMTTDADLVVSRVCGRELNLKLAYEGSHDCRASGRLQHRLRGSGEEREVYAALLRAEAPWAESIAAALGRAPSDDADSARMDGIVRAAAGIPTVTTTPSAGHPGYLTSWLLNRAWMSDGRKNGGDDETRTRDLCRDSSNSDDDSE